MAVVLIVPKSLKKEWQKCGVGRNRGGSGRNRENRSREAAANGPDVNFLAQISGMGSIPIARSITHDDSIVLTPLNQLNTATKLGVLVP